MKRKKEDGLFIGRLDQHNVGFISHQSQTEQVVRKLIEFDTEYGRNKGTFFRYIQFGDLLLPLSKLFNTPALAVKAVSKVAGGDFTLQPAIKLPFLCHSVWICTNLRIYEYNSDRNLTVKIALDNIFRRGLLLREVRARKLVAAKAEIDNLIPEIIEFDRAGGKWIVEEMIRESKENCSRAEKAEEFIAQIARPFYQATVRLKPLSKYIAENPFDSMERSLAEIIIKAQSYELEYLWPVALCHGDLSPDNMIINEKSRLYLVDWEFAALNPVAYDLAKIYNNYPELRNKILDLLATITGDSKRSLNPNLQMAVALARRYTGTRNKIEEQLKAMNNDNTGLSAILADRLEEKLAIHKQLIGELIEDI